MSRFKDVVVLLPGITGSVLADAKGKEVWSPTLGTAWRLLTSFGQSITGLELDASGNPDGITAPRLIPDATIVPGLVKIDGYTRIEDYLVAQLGLERGLNYLPFPYDWRLDNRVNAKRLEQVAMDALGRAAISNLERHRLGARNDVRPTQRDEAELGAGEYVARIRGGGTGAADGDEADVAAEPTFETCQVA